MSDVDWFSVPHLPYGEQVMRRQNYAHIYEVPPMRSIKRPGGFLHRILHQFYTYLLHCVFLYTEWAYQPTHGSEAASRAVEPAH